MSAVAGGPLRSTAALLLFILDSGRCASDGSVGGPVVGSNKGIPEQFSMVNFSLLALNSFVDLRMLSRM